MYKMNIDGRNKKTLVEDPVLTLCAFICDDVSRLSGISIAGSWIYYKEYANDILCRVSLDGKINEKLEEITKH